MTRHLPRLADGLQWRFVHGASCESYGTSLAKRTTRREMQEVGRLTAQSFRGCQIANQQRDGSHQPLRIGVARVLNYVLDKAAFHHATGIHDNHPIYDLRNHRDIMGDENERKLSVSSYLI